MAVANRGTPRLHILFVTDYFPPEIAAPAHLVFDLASEFVRLGHRVTVVTGFPRYNVSQVAEAYRGRLTLTEDMGGIRVLRVFRPGVDRAALLLRGLDHLLAPFLAFVRALVADRPDIVLVLSPPLTLALTGYGLKLLRGSRLVTNVQDLFPQNAIDLGVMKNQVVISFFRRLERFVYVASDVVTVHSPGNANHVIGVAPGAKVAVVSNWVDTSKLLPQPRTNWFSEQHRLDGRFIVSFAGTMGFSQDMDVILDAAKLLRNDPSIVFLLIGDGVQKERVAAEVERRALGNVVLMPTQPREVYPWALASSDTSLATLKPDVLTPTVPSKILSIMAAARPVIGCMNLDGDAPALIRESGAGIALPPADPQALADAIRMLRDNPDLCRSMGERGRRYIEEHLSLQAAAAQYVELFSTVLSPRRGYAQQG